MEEEYNPTPVIYRIRTHVESWRALKNQADWGVTPATGRLLAHWRHHTFEDVRPFLCQVEAVETMIWLTEVARKSKRQYGSIWEHILGANELVGRLASVGLWMQVGVAQATVRQRAGDRRMQTLPRSLSATHPLCGACAPRASLRPFAQSCREATEAASAWATSARSFSLSAFTL